MDNHKNNYYYIDKINGVLKNAIDTYGSFSYEKFSDHFIYDGFEYCLRELGNYSIHIDDSFKKEHPSIPWTSFDFFREDILNARQTVNAENMYQTFKQCNALSLQIEKILQEDKNI